MRLAYTRNRLACLNGVPTVLVNHWPLHRETTQILRHPEFGLWCGTDQSARWHIEYNAKVVVYGHLHIPRIHRALRRPLRGSVGGIPAAVESSADTQRLVA